MTTTITTGDNRGIIAGRDIKDTNLINTGDVSGSYNAIGVGAQVIVQQVQAVSPVDERRKAMRFSQALLADAIEAKVGDYTKQLSRDQSDSRRNPYKALPAYQLVDAPYFYGREEAIGDLLDYIHQSPLTVLHAASSAGKSSLLQAGLMSRLLAAGHLPLYIRTKAQSSGQTEQAGLTSVIKTAFLPSIPTDPDLASLNTASLLGFLTDVSRSLGQSSLYVFLDQFEDFFNDALMHPILRRPFVAELNDCLDEPGLDVRWVLSLRKEYYSDLHIFSDTIFHNQIYLPGLSTTEAEQVIVNPAQQRDVIYEGSLDDKGLVRQILQDLSVQDGENSSISDNVPTVTSEDANPIESTYFAPTQIQLICHTLFDELEDDETTITFDLYNKRRGRRHLSGAEGILTGHLQNVLTTKLPPEARQLASLVLEELVTSQTRRIPRRLDELMAQLGRRQQSIDEGRVQRILKTLVNNRILELDDDQATYELTHDYLLKEIELNPETKARKACQELLNQETATWLADKRSRLGEEKLRIVEEQQDELLISDDAAELLRLSREAIGRRRRTVLFSYGAAGVAVTIAIIAGIIAIIFLRQADSTQRQVTAAKAQVERLNIEADLLNLSNLMRIESQGGRHNAALLLAQEAILRTTVNKINYTAAFDMIRESLRSAPPLRHTLSCHEDNVHSASFSSDGSQVVTASWDTTAKVWDVTMGKVVQILTGHKRRVISADFSPDDSLVATASEDGTAKVWDVASGKEIYTLLGHTALVYSVVFSSDGRLIVSTSADGTAKIWDVVSGQEVYTLSGHTSKVTSAVFSPDEGRIVTASRDDTARVWDVASGREILTLSGHSDTVVSAVFNHDGNRIVTASRDDTARVWDVATGEVRRVISSHEGNVTSSNFNHDGTQLVTASSDGTARVWDVATGEVVHTLSGHEGGVTSAIFSPDSIQIVTVSRDGPARVWDVETGEVAHILSGHEDIVVSAVFNHDGSQIITASRDNTAKVWDMGMGDVVHTYSGHKETVYSVKFNHDETRLVTASSDGTAKVWDVATGEIWRTISADEGYFISASFSPDSSQVLTAGSDGTAKVWDAVAGKILHSLSIQSEIILSASFNYDGSQVIAVGSGGTAKVWNVETEEELYTLSEHKERVLSAAFSHDSSRIAIVTIDGKAKIWDVASRKALQTLVGHHGNVISAVFNYDSSRVVTAGVDGTARVWDVLTGEIVQIFTGHHDSVASAVFNRDSSQVVTASIDGTARVWDVVSGKEIHTLTGHANEVYSAIFNHDSSQVVTASVDGTAKIWMLDMEVLLRLIHKRIQRHPPEFTEEELIRFGISDPIPFPMTVE